MDARASHPRRREVARVSFASLGASTRACYAERPGGFEGARKLRLQVPIKPGSQQQTARQAGGSHAVARWTSKSSMRTHRGPQDRSARTGGWNLPRKLQRWGNGRGSIGEQRKRNVECSADSTGRALFVGSGRRTTAIFNPDGMHSYLDTLNRRQLFLECTQE